MANTVSATDLKNKIADVLNRVVYAGSETIIERHGKPIAKIVPIEKPSKEDIKKTLDRLFGSMPDFPDVKRSRYFRRRAAKL